VIAAAMFFMGLTEYSNKAWELEKNTVPILQNSIASALVKIISSAALLPLFGTIGAAYGTLSAFLFYFIVSSLRAKRLFLFSVGIRRAFNIFASALLCGVSARLASRFIGGIPGLAAAVAAGAAVYFIALAVSGEIKEELYALRKMLLKTKGGTSV
jgi:O-antigen/teichoic acid export membrane protein